MRFEVSSDKMAECKVRERLSDTQHFVRRRMSHKGSLEDKEASNGNERGGGAPEWVWEWQMNEMHHFTLKNYFLSDPLHAPHIHLYEYINHFQLLG